MCVGGLDGCKEEHEKEAVVNDMLMFALLVSKACSYVQLDETKNVKMRIGMHCGEMATGVTGTLMCIIALMHSPNPTDPLNRVAGQLMQDNPLEYEATVRSWTAEYAMGV